MISLGCKARSDTIIEFASVPYQAYLYNLIIVALSDKTWAPGLGAEHLIFLLVHYDLQHWFILFPFSSSLWMPVGLLWLLDAANNTAMEPYRAFIANKLVGSQQRNGFPGAKSFSPASVINTANVFI